MILPDPDEDGVEYYHWQWNENICQTIAIMNVFPVTSYEKVDLFGMILRCGNVHDLPVIITHATMRLLQDAGFYDHIKILNLMGVEFEDDVAITSWPKNIHSIIGTGFTRNIIAFLASLPLDLQIFNFDHGVLNEAESAALIRFMMRATQLDHLCVWIAVSELELIYTAFKANPNIIELSTSSMDMTIENLISIRKQNRAIRMRNSRRHEQMLRKFVLLPNMSLDLMRIVMSFVLEIES